MLEELIIQIIKAVIIGLWGVIWIQCLVARGAIFSFLPRWYYKKAGSYCNSPRWASDLAKPLFECAVCHAGWVAIFSQMSIHVFSYYMLFVSVVVSMATALFITKWLNQ